MPFSDETERRAVLRLTASLYAAGVEELGLYTRLKTNMRHFCPIYSYRPPAPLPSFCFVSPSPRSYNCPKKSLYGTVEVHHGWWQTSGAVTWG